MEGTASAQIPATLVWSTARAAALIAAGQQVAAASASAAILMRGVLKAMFIKKLVNLAVGVVAVTAALSVAGAGYRVAGFGNAAQAAADKPVSEVDSLRKEVELLRLNLQIVLEKVRAQEKELQTLRKPVSPVSVLDGVRLDNVDLGFALPADRVILDKLNLNFEPSADLIIKLDELRQQPSGASEKAVPDAAREVEVAVKALREARDKDGQRRAAEALEKAMKKLKEQLK
jgi:hypothetical protein